MFTPRKNKRERSEQACSLSVLKMFSLEIDACCFVAQRIVQVAVIYWAIKWNAINEHEKRRYELINSNNKYNWSIEINISNTLLLQSSGRTLILNVWFKVDLWNVGHLDSAGPFDSKDLLLVESFDSLELSTLLVSWLGWILCVTKSFTFITFDPSRTFRLDGYVYSLDLLPGTIDKWVPLCKIRGETKGRDVPVIRLC